MKLFQSWELIVQVAIYVVDCPTLTGIHARAHARRSCISSELACRSALLNMTLGTDNGAFLHLNLEG